MDGNIVLRRPSLAAGFQIRLILTIVIGGLPARLGATVVDQDCEARSLISAKTSYQATSTFPPTSTTRLLRSELLTARAIFPKVDDFSSLFPKVDDSQARPPSVSPGQLHSRTLRHRLLRSHRARLVARKSPSCPPLMFVGRVGATFLLLLPPSPELPSYQHSHTRHSRSTLQRRSLRSPPEC